MDSPTRRPTKSALPPAANGTISRIGLSGYAASAARDASEASGAAAMVVRRWRRGSIGPPGGFLWLRGVGIFGGGWRRGKPPPRLGGGGVSFFIPPLSAPTR